MKLIKSFNLLLVIVFLFVLVGCGGKDPQSGVEEPETSIKDQFPCITIEEAISIAKQAGETETTEKYYVYGIIKSVSKPEYGEMTITDGTNELYVYGSTDENGNFYSSLTDKPVKGDEVVLYGGLKTYKDTPEMGRSVIKAFKHVTPEIDENEYKSIDIRTARESVSGTKVKLEGVVGTITYAFGKVPNGFYLIDNTGSIYVYGGDVAQQVSVGNKVTIAAEKTFYINPDEASNAEKYGYTGACQVQNAILLKNDKGNHEFDKSWIKESTVKDIVEASHDVNITSDIFKVTALIKKVPGSGFTNYYINDLDGVTGSYVYTQCSGSDFDWLDKYDNKICTVYLSAINCKSTNSGTIYRLLPIKVEELQNYTFDVKEICDFAIKYYVYDQFATLYKNDPALELITSVSSELLGIENVSISYSSNDNNVIYFENNVMHTKNVGKATVTITATYSTFTATKTIEITVEQPEVSDFVNVKTAVESTDGTKLRVKGVVVSSLVNKTGFYIADETGIIAVQCSGEVLKEVKLGNLVILEGTKKHSGVKDGNTDACQIVLDEAIVVINYYGEHEYSKQSFITGKTISDIVNLDSTEDHSAEVYIVEGKVVFIETPYYTTLEIQSVDGTAKLNLYSSSANQYNWLKEFVGETVTFEIAPCNWNAKGYKGCVISATVGDKTVVNSLNFQ